MILILESFPSLCVYLFSPMKNFHCFPIRVKKYVQEISKEAETLLLEYAWPGNVRELKNVLERAVILCTESVLTTELLYITPNLLISKEDGVVSDLRTSSEALDEVEKEHILNVLEKYNGNKSQTARVLNISRSTLREKLKLYGIS